MPDSIKVSRELFDLLKIRTFGEHDHEYDLYSIELPELARRLHEIHKPKPRLSLREKIFAISNACPIILRNGVGYSADPDRPVYPYVKIEDVLDAINPLLKKYKLILTGNVPKEPITHVSKLGATTETLVEWTLTDIETGEEKMYRVPGAGLDFQGKGVYKSMTGSRKYACVLIFNLKFGDEPEAVQLPAKEEASATRSEN